MGTMISDPLIGHVLDGRYRVDERIARGGMATVYLARDTRLDRTVALKAMHPSLADDDSFVSRFIGEAKSAARLSHPNVVSVYDQGTDSGVVFLTMEYLSGRTARDLLTERRQLEPDEALHIMEAVLSALAAAHQAGFVHRDVKPENVLLAEDGRIKVGDFGLARAIAGSNHTKTSGLLIGTVAYLSPEQVARGYSDARSDVYSAGILLFELLTGSQPFTGETPLAVAYNHVNTDVPPPSQFADAIPREVDGLVAAATRRDPDRRPADASGLLALTTRVRDRIREGPPAGQEQTLATPQQSNETLVVATDDLVPGMDGAPSQEGRGGTDPWNRLAATLRSHRAWVVLAGVLVLALVASGVGYYYGWARWTQTPTLTGMKLEAATRKATGAGFEVKEVNPRFSGKVPAGRIIATEPKAGTRILNGGTITLVPSKGKRRVPVPKLRGQSPSSAKQAVRDADFKVGDTSRDYSDSVPTGKVIRSKPGAGTTLTVGSTVDLVVSAGVKVPDVVGLSKEDAQATLEDKGFTVEVIEERHDENVPAGVVITQVPSGGGAERGSVVELTVSLGPKPIPVPDVLGQDTSQAAKILEDAGFKVDIQDSPWPGHSVMRQDPPAGTKLPAGSTVTIYAI